MIQKLGAKGIKLNERNLWDDGSDHDDVAKIYVRGGCQGIGSIYFNYVKSGKLKDGKIYGFFDYGFTQTFEIDHLRDEHLESVDAYYNTKSYGLQAIQFKTNFRTSEMMGYDWECTMFTLAVKGKKIIGFHGTDDKEIFSLGAYFTSITPTRLEARGGIGGKKWDDGFDHENISKIEVLGGIEGILYIKTDYVKNGKLESGLIRGDTGDGFTQKLEINQSENEYLVHVECYYDDASNVIQGIHFKTNNINNSVMIGYSKGRKFSLASSGNRIVGFHGNADKSLKSLGAYFSTATPNKLEYQGDPRGLLWDDDCNYDGVRKVYVDCTGTIYSVRFEYDNGGKVERRNACRRDFKNEKEFVLDYPNEFITSVEGTLINLKSTTLKMTWISSLIFKTSKNRTSPTFGTVSDGRKFVLGKNDSALVGFHGYDNVGLSTLNALGAYYRPFPPTPDAVKLEAQGGNRGASWDDGGTFNSVNKIYIGLSEKVIGFVKFMYFKSANLVIGDDHGNKTMITRVEEFELDPFEKIKSVEGTYDDKSGGITMLRFKTDKQDSPYFAFGTTPTFVLHKDNHQIVGFHGKSRNMLHQLGIHVLPNGFKFVF
ncbi:PREDICTED: jacalin-related lectin 44-like [Camelina sativa]|uniref:Jacalin-related lectin 44-like n=1 Tax=Camelina sativa TaxID=90675 RepID=A0ABM1QR75_CAMSA|nr:PREDICTED: jacalin-related lectin 44-like [Camelina sativa]